MRVLAALLLVGCAADPGPVCDLDPALSAEDCATLHAMALPATLAPARGNAVGDDVNAAVLGFQIFFDARFSSNLQLRCASCHSPEDAFGDDLAVAVAQGPITRNSPTVLNAARMTWQFWDGRADTIWSQPLFAFENPNELGFSRLAIAHGVQAWYGAPYEAVFGALPDLTALPASGKPGDPAWDALSADDQLAIDTIAANVGKSIEAYLRQLAAGAAPFDRYLAGDATAFTDAERHGMVVFVQSGCATCHRGPALSDDLFHNLGVAAWPGVDPDLGRAHGLELLAANEFNSQGKFFDGPDGDRTPIPVATAADLGAIRTPSLRNVAISAPYGHNGRFAALGDVIDFHTAGGGQPGDAFVGTVDPLLTPCTLSADERADLIAFLGALTGERTGKPWNDWPGQ